MSTTESVLCSKTHEYVIDNGNKNYTVGLTDYAVEQLGDIVFLELPEVGASFTKGEVFATVESVKAASEIYMPISGVVTEINEKVVDSPETLNENPFAEGWLVKIDFTGENVELSDLMGYKDYKEEVQ
ncbi:glycine cleavage system protein GcvH [bacterium]|nr:glycine cleavage system protein GcvH [bacterium]